MRRQRDIKLDKGKEQKREILKMMLEERYMRGKEELVPKARELEDRGRQTIQRRMRKKNKRENKK